MGFEQKIGRTGLAFVVLLAALPATAAPPEPLVVTRLSDPDPNYVPSPSERTLARRSAEADDAATINAAMQEFGQALGQAAMAQRRAIEERCRSNDASSASSEDRLAWEAACRYMRR
jgi:hypothetical protein